MVSVTECESKTSFIIKKLLASASNREPVLNDLMGEIKLSPFIFEENMPKIMVVTMPLQLLINAKLQYSEIIAELKKEFPKYVILTKRTAEIPKNDSKPNRIREELISDLLFPAIVVARTNEVETRDDQTQVVYLDNKNLCWNKQEIYSLEKLLKKTFELNFKIKIFGLEI